jgi:hydrogenase maturation protein HypF
VNLPAGFERAPDVLALGGELKAAFCLARAGQAVLSQPQGDLENVDTFDAFRRDVARCDAAVGALAVDCHPEYLSSKLGRSRARLEALALIEVQHHHAHVAACMVDNARPLAAPPVLGIVLDGLGWGADGTFWGGEFLLADYRSAQRLATFKPVAMPGGAQAIHEPWRNLYAHLMAEMGWAKFAMDFAQLELYRYLAAKPRALLDAMLRNGINAPLASSCGRLFDAVAAAVGVCRERQRFEGEAACRLESMIEARAPQDEDAYPFTLPNLRGSGLPYIEPLAMWNALLGDLILGTPPGVIAARFHNGLARAIVAMARKLEARCDTVVLSGGCFQNAVLSAQVMRRLRAAGFTVLVHSRVPAHDGGLALGQAAIGAARLMGAG